ncbi:hypothetical protein ACOYR4_15490 [Acidovorax sp. M14]|uniref:hypothetical protein n=1 Tax=Acidovorax sp. M14 TaxID=3411354 RepID=UPI003BF5335F
MTNKLKPRKLDIVIDRLTPRTVYYKLFIGGKEEYWRIPPNSTFDTSVLEPGQRYHVYSTGILVNDFDFRKQQTHMVERYDWVTAVPVTNKAKLAARTTKKRLEDENAPPIVDSGLLEW